MGALIHLLADYNRKQDSPTMITRLAKKMGQLSEPFWFALSLALFLAMGPFSVIAVIIALYHLATAAPGGETPETA